jgi:retinol dehydrogenase 12
MTNSSMTSMRGKTVLVTGATNGIGFCTARGLAEAGARILLHGRNTDLGQAAVKTIEREVPGAEVVFVKANLAKLSDVGRLAEEVLNLAPKLDVLVNNAGIVQDRRSVTADGIEMTFAVNHLAPFYLTSLLLDRLKASTSARIVNVTSNAHRGVALKFDDLNAERSYSGGMVYSRSKLANILFTRELARRLDGTGVTANCVHPGAVRSGFARGEKGMVGMVYQIFGRFFLSPEMGARTSIYVATAPELTRITGQYFAKCKSVMPSRQAQDDDAAKRLWEVSEKLLSLAV